MDTATKPREVSPCASSCHVTKGATARAKPPIRNTKPSMGSHALAARPPWHHPWSSQGEADMTEHNFGALRAAVITASRSQSWAEAVQEWQVVSAEEDPHGTGICVCGKTGLVHLYTIDNQETQSRLFPIGSSCVRLFEVEDLNARVSVLRQLIELRTAYESGKTVYLTSEYFSRALLGDLWENGAFPPNGFNRSNGANDYHFLLDLFNQRHDFTERERRKVWVLLNQTIKQFVINDERIGWAR